MAYLKTVMVYLSSDNDLKKLGNLQQNKNPLLAVCKMPSERGKKAELTALILGVGLIVTGFSWFNKRHESHSFQGTATQVGFLLWLGLIIMSAELLHRICLLMEEIYRLDSLYSGSVSKLMLQVFGARASAIFASCIIMLSFLFTCILEPRVLAEVNTHWSLSLGLAGLYLILISVFKVHENPVDHEALLDDKLLAIGHGLAYSYFYGFLKIVLPPGPTERGQVKSLCERAKDFEAEEKIQLASRKLFIMIPDTCFCHPSFQDMAPGQIERVEKLEDVVISRAGMKGRPYSTTVYRILPEGRSKPIYVLMEMPAILYVLYEMNTVGSDRSRLSSFERSKQAQSFCRILHRLLKNDQACKDTYEIIYYKDQEVNLAELIYERVLN